MRGTVRGRRAAVAVGLLVSVALADSLRGMSWWTIAPAVAVLAVGVFLRALRWRALFEPDRRPTTGAVTSALLIGSFFNSILPARLGEPARVVALSRESRLGYSEVLAASVLERAIDLLVLLALLFAALPFLPEVAWLRSAVVLAAVLAAVIAAAALAMNRAGDRPLRALARWVAGFSRRVSHERLDRVAAGLTRGAAPLRRGRVATEGIILTVASWLVLACSNWILLRGFGLDLGFEAALLVAIASNLALVVPAGPGGVGPFEAGTVVALSSFGVGTADALSYSLVLHAVNLVPYLVAGYAALHRHVVVVRERAAADYAGGASS